MKKETLEKIERWNQTPPMNETEKKALRFIKNFAELGLLDYVETNDWSSCPSPKVYLVTPCPNHKTKCFKRFSDREMKSGLKFLNANTGAIKEILEYLRGEIKAERVSYGEIAVLQSLAEYIEDGDVELLEWAGVPEFEEENGDL